MRELDEIRRSKAAARPDRRCDLRRQPSVPSGYSTQSVRSTGWRAVNQRRFDPPIAPAWKLAEEKGAEYISFPSISTGVYGYPVREAAAIAIDEVVCALKEAGRKLQRVVFVLFDDRTHAAYAEALTTDRAAEFTLEYRQTCRFYKPDSTNCCCSNSTRNSSGTSSSRPASSSR